MDVLKVMAGDAVSALRYILRVAMYLSAAIAILAVYAGAVWVVAHFLDSGLMVTNLMIVTLLIICAAIFLWVDSAKFRIRRRLQPSSATTKEDG